MLLVSILVLSLLFVCANNIISIKVDGKPPFEKELLLCKQYVLFVLCLFAITITHLYNILQFFTVEKSNNKFQIKNGDFFICLLKT